MTKPGLVGDMHDLNSDDEIVCVKMYEKWLELDEDRKNEEQVMLLTNTILSNIPSSRATPGSVGDVHNYDLDSDNEILCRDAGKIGTGGDGKNEKQVTLLQPYVKIVMVTV